MRCFLIRSLSARRARSGIAATNNMGSEPLHACVARLHCPATAVVGGRRLALPEALRPARSRNFATQKDFKFSMSFLNMESKRY